MVRKSNAHVTVVHRAEVARTKRLEAEVHAEAGDMFKAREAARVADVAATLAQSWADEVPHDLGAARIARRAREDANAANAPQQ